VVKAWLETIKSRTFLELIAKTGLRFRKALIMDYKKLPQDVLNATIKGLHLRAGTLGEQLGSGIQLLVFLRHLG